MASSEEPVILELAPLPREQIGPFLLLGLSKGGDREAIEANWAQRVIWARKKQFRMPLEDVNWAREMVNDPDRRVRADVTSLNLDTASRILEQLVERQGGSGPAWQPLDQEKSLAEYRPPTEVPDLDDVKAAIAVPEVPREMPAATQFLDQFLREPLDPWALPLTSDPRKGNPA